MGIIDDLGDQLALETLKAQEELGDDRFYMEVSKVLGDRPRRRLQEAFMTSMRIRMAAQLRAQFPSSNRR